MSASTTVRVPSDAAPDPVYALRDDLARVHQPANAHERMLVTAVAQAWLRLQQAHELERDVFAKTPPLELFTSSLATFKALTRHVAECDRMWRRAIGDLERAKRQSAASQPPQLRAPLHPPSSRRAHTPRPPRPVLVAHPEPAPSPDAPASGNPSPPGAKLVQL